MTTLHTVNKTSHHQALQLAQIALAEGDALLFIEDGVTALISGSQSAQQLSTLSSQHRIYCLDADVQARGLASRLPEWVNLATYDDFVTLTAQHSRTLSWF